MNGNYLSNETLASNSRCSHIISDKSQENLQNEPKGN